MKEWEELLELKPNVEIIRCKDREAAEKFDKIYSKMDFAVFFAKVHADK